MRAITHARFTGPEGLALTDVPAPLPDAGEVVVDVSHAAPNPIDWHLLRGTPRLLRLVNRSAPWPRGVGEDVAGTVAATGAGVDGLAVGDPVFGTLPAGRKRAGTFAEQVAVPLDWVTRRPDAVPADQAGAVGLAGLTALQALRDAGRLRPGGRVLVWGSAGGVGHLAVQIARALGASRVDAVCSTRSVAWMRELGADAVFDYTAGEVPDGPYDVVIDTVCTASVATLARIVARGGRVVTIGAVRGGRRGGAAWAMVSRTLASPLRGLHAGSVVTRVNSADLGLLAGWMADGRLRVSVERTYPLADAAAMMADLEAGRVRGKLVLTVDR